MERRRLVAELRSMSGTAYETEGDMAANMIEGIARLRDLYLDEITWDNAARPVLEQVCAEISEIIGD